LAKLIPVVEGVARVVDDGGYKLLREHIGLSP